MTASLWLLWEIRRICPTGQVVKRNMEIIRKGYQCFQFWLALSSLIVLIALKEQAPHLRQFSLADASGPPGVPSAAVLKFT